MNKQEVIKEIEQMYVGIRTIVPFKERIISLIDQIDDRPKVRVPKFVGYFIKKHKAECYTLSEVIDSCMSDEVADWFYKNGEIFARAWLDGYEVEQKKKYKVKGGHSYFSKFDEVMAIVVLDDMTGYEDYVKHFDSLEEAQKVAEQLGWEVEEVEKSDE